MREAWSENEILKHIEETHGIELTWKGKGWTVRPQIRQTDRYGYRYRPLYPGNARISWYINGSDISFEDRYIHTRGSMMVSKLTKEKLAKKLDAYCEKAAELAKQTRDRRDYKENRQELANRLIDQWGRENLGVSLTARPYGKYEVSFTALFDGYDALFRFTFDEDGIKTVRFEDPFKLDDEVNDLLVRVTKFKVKKRLEQMQPKIEF